MVVFILFFKMQHKKLVKVGQQTIVDALFRTFNEIECPLPNSMVSNGMLRLCLRQFFHAFSYNYFITKI